jgi:hypothetical protein
LRPLSPRDRWLLEGTVALALFVFIAAQPNLFALLRAGAVAIGGGVRSMVALTATDSGTAWPALAAVAKVALLLAPVVRLLRGAPRRLVWLPLLGLVFVGVLGNLVPAISSWPMALLFLAAAVAGFAAARRPWLRALAFLPWLVALEPMFGHSPLAASVWTPERLLAHCAGNDGVRPSNLAADMVMTRYYSATPVSAQRMLVTGERRSFWADREADAVRLTPTTGPLGNLWQGCLKGETLWLTKRAHVCSTTGPDAFACPDVAGPPELGPELDYTDVICGEGDAVYLGQLVRGGMLELTTSTGTTRWHPVMPGLNLQMVPRRDGRIVGITTSRLFVFDPRGDTLLEDQPAGIVAMGVDLCPSDDAIAVTDFTGRLRLFDRQGEGYAFRAGVSLPAPRRVAFSPGCDRLLVTSGDDRHAFLLRRSDLSIVRTYQLGPGLRDVTFLDEKTAAAVDGCTVNLLNAAP